MTKTHAPAPGTGIPWLIPARIVELGFFLVVALALHAGVFFAWRTPASSPGSGPASETAVLRAMTADTAALIAAWEAPAETEAPADPAEVTPPRPESEPSQGQTVPDAADPPAGDISPAATSPDPEPAQNASARREAAERIPTPRVRPIYAGVERQEPHRVQRAAAKERATDTTLAQRDTKPPQSVAAAPASGVPASRNAPVEAPAHSISDAERVSLLRAYGAAVSAAIAEKRRYPHQARQRRQEGTVLMAVTLSRTGQLIDARVSSSSGYGRLDSASLAAARAVERFPPAPSRLAGTEFSFAIPIRFEIR